MDKRMIQLRKTDGIITVDVFHIVAVEPADNIYHSFVTLSTGQRFEVMHDYAKVVMVLREYGNFSQME